MGKAPLKKPPELEHTPANCHAREILARVGDKWSVYVIHVLNDAGTLRFNELRSRVAGISQRMLTVTLRGMERDGLVTRTVYPEVPPRVEYRLTELGSTLRQLVRGLVEWSGAHLREVDAARAAYDARNLRPTKSPPLARPAQPVARPAPPVARPAALRQARRSLVVG
jgi:DNA-binding HxlR family transcriptional regulator